jgi:hypothetical protein
MARDWGFRNRAGRRILGGPITEDAARMDDTTIVGATDDAEVAMDYAEVAAAPISLSAEHAWEAAAPILYPVLRPAGTVGLLLETIESPSSVAGNVDPLIDDGPVDLVVAYAMAGEGFDVLANGDHLSAWGVSAETLRDAAFGNLEAWSNAAPWSVEADEGRRVISSDTGDGWDASRILLPDVAAYLESELGAAGSRIVVGLPARHLLIASSLRPDDPDFAPLFADFVLEYAGDSDESIDRRIFELRDGVLELFDPAVLA